MLASLFAISPPMVMPRELLKQLHLSAKDVYEDLESHLIPNGMLVPPAFGPLRRSNSGNTRCCSLLISLPRPSRADDA